MKKSTLWILAALAFAPSAQAQPISKLMSHFEDEITRTDLAVEKATALSQGEKEGQDEWEFSLFSIGIAPYVSVGIHDIVELQIQPEITMIWEKVTADNWVEAQ